MTKKTAKFHKDQFKTVRGVAPTNYNPIVLTDRRSLVRTDEPIVIVPSTNVGEQIAACVARFPIRALAQQNKQFKDEMIRKQAYSNTLKILPPKNENFQKKKKTLIFFLFLLKI